jgi:hypothetical protein
LIGAAAMFIASKFDVSSIWLHLEKLLCYLLQLSL